MKIIQDFHLIGNKLQSIRKSRGLTRSEAAEKSDVSDRTYADIERGASDMKLTTFLKICNGLTISPDELLTDSDKKYSSESEIAIEKLNALFLKEQDLVDKMTDALKQNK